MSQEALGLVNTLLSPKRLSYVQELVFVHSWTGKMYREIAVESGYDLDYIKEVGSQLWNLLSDILGEKVTKKNVRLILTRYYSTDSGDRLGLARRVGDRMGAIAHPAHIPHQPSDLWEFPSGSVPLHSHLYIDRPLLEDRAYAEIARPGGLIRIRAPQQMGKTSLLLRVLAHARSLGYHTILLNLHQVDSHAFASLDQFLRWLCLYLSRQLNLRPQLDQYWDPEIGSKVSCNTYLQEYVLAQLQSPIVLALDEVNSIFAYPHLVQDFLPLLRSWYEAAAEQKIWQKLRLAVVHSTEAHVPLSLSQSPFNVGLPISLAGFTLAQLRDLAGRYELDQFGIAATELDPLMQLVNGHPYLLRLALHWLRQGEITLERLLREAPTQSGIYSDHLRRHWDRLQRHPELQRAMQQVVAAPAGVRLEAIAAYHLESMGLVKLNGNEVSPSCTLYRQFFSEQLQMD